MNRIDYMIVLSNEESDVVSSFWDVPVFIKHPHRNFKYEEINIDEKFIQK